MDNLVFLDRNKSTAIPFTTSKIIAEYAKVQKQTVDRLIRSREKDLEAFGLVGFEIRAVDEKNKIRRKNAPDSP